MSNRYARGLLAIAAAAIAAMPGITTALAATTWTVRPGGSVSLKSGQFALKDARTGSVLICTSAVITGTLKSGSGLPGTGIGSITTVDITGCNPGGIVFTITATGLPWHVNFTSYNAANGVATGSVSHARLLLSGPSCTAVIGGTTGTAANGQVKFRYADSTARLMLLTTGGNLHFYDVDGCAGLLFTSDPATLSATFTTSPKQTITSP